MCWGYIRSFPSSPGSVNSTPLHSQQHRLAQLNPPTLQVVSQPTRQEHHPHNDYSEPWVQTLRLS